MINCPYCQTENNEQSKFCSNCGGRLEIETKPEAPEDVPEIPMEEVLPVSPPPANVPEEDEWQSVNTPGFSPGPQSQAGFPPPPPPPPGYQAQQSQPFTGGQSFQPVPPVPPVPPGQAPFAPPPAYPPAPKSPKKGKGALIGILVGALVLIGLCIALILLVVKPFLKRASDPNQLATLVIRQLSTEIGQVDETPEVPMPTNETSPDDTQPTDEPGLDDAGLPEVPGYKVLYYENFGPDTELTDFQDGEIDAVVKSNSYELTIKKKNFEGWKTSDSINDINTVSQVNAELISGHEYTTFGLICRFVDGDNYMQGAVGFDGWIILRQYIDGEEIRLVDRMLYGISETKNTISLACVDDTISLFVNGLQVAVAIDQKPIYGDVGFSVGNYSDDNTTVDFTQFKVYGVEGNELITKAQDLPFTNLIQSDMPYEQASYFYQNDLLSEEDAQKVRMGETENYKASFEDGKYLLTLKQPTRYVTSVTSSLNFMDMVVNVTAVEFDPEGAVGVVCRYQSTTNLYGFDISQDGWATIYKYINGKYTELYGEYHENVISEYANTIVATCVDDMLTLTVNGEVITTVQDSDLISGDGGMIAHSFEVAPISAHFKYFMVFPVPRD